MWKKIMMAGSIARREFFPISRNIFRLKSRLISSIIFLIAVSFVATMSTSAYGDDVWQEWIPSAIEFPDDAEVLIDQEIGAVIRMLSFTTAEDADELLSDWRMALHAEGYTISEPGVGSMEQAIEFSGGGISNAKIIVAPSSSEGRSVIEFDATLN